MPKWNIGAFNNANVWFVTFSASTAISFYRVSAVTFGRPGAGAVPVVSMSNVVEASGITGTMFYGGINQGGDCQTFDAGIPLKADQNAFVTLTWAAAQTGSLAVAYEIIRK